MLNNLYDEIMAMGTIIDDTIEFNLEEFRTKLLEVESEVEDILCEFDM